VPKRAAPDYFLQALTDLNLAEALATQCELLSIDPAKTALLTDEVLARLEADGFDPADPVTQMLDARDELMALQQGFVDRHGLAGADRDAYCAAGATDLVAQVGPGAYLIAVPAQ